MSLVKMSVIMWLEKTVVGPQNFLSYWMSVCPLVTMTLLEFPMRLAFICTSQNISPYFFFPFTFPDTYLPGCQRSREESDMTSILAALFQSVFIPTAIHPNIFPSHKFPSWEQREVCKLNVDSIPSRILLPTASKVDIFRCLPIYISFFLYRQFPMEIRVWNLGSYLLWPTQFMD